MNTLRALWNRWPVNSRGPRGLTWYVTNKLLVYLKYSVVVHFIIKKSSLWYVENALVWEYFPFSRSETSERSFNVPDSWFSSFTIYIYMHSQFFCTENQPKSQWFIIIITTHLLSLKIHVCWCVTQLQPYSCCVPCSLFPDLGWKYNPSVGHAYCHGWKKGKGGWWMPLTASAQSWHRPWPPLFHWPKRIITWPRRHQWSREVYSSRNWPANHITLYRGG